MINDSDKIEDILEGLEAGDFNIEEAEGKQEQKLEKSEKTIEQAKEKVQESGVEKELTKDEAPNVENEDNTSTTALPTAPSVQKSVVYTQIEGILADGLEDVYTKLSPKDKLEFKKTGEETASKITEAMKSAKLKVNKVFQLIINWLKIIPGVNKFFLEQEAKIKVDRIVELRKRMNK